jgi:hypothetical protein
MPLLYHGEGDFAGSKSCRVVLSGLHLVAMSKDFHDYYFSLPLPQRDAVAAKAQTTIGYLERVAGGFRLPTIPTAMKIVRATGNKTSLRAIIRTYEKRNGAF